MICNTFSGVVLPFLCRTYGHGTAQVILNPQRLPMVLISRSQSCSIVPTRSSLSVHVYTRQPCSILTQTRFEATEHFTPFAHTFISYIYQWGLPPRPLGHTSYVPPVCAQVLCCCDSKFVTDPERGYHVSDAM